MISLHEQELYGWIGNAIFLTAQGSQIIYTYKIKKADDFSYTLFFFWIIGEMMYTVFGYIDESPSMFYGNGASLLLSFVQLSQKIYYKKVRNNLNDTSDLPLIN